MPFRSTIPCAILLLISPLVSYSQDGAKVETTRVTFEVTDSKSSKPLPARVYLRGSGGWLFVESSVPQGSAVRYQKRNWINASAEEFHTTISAHPFHADLATGDYELIIERGKEYVPSTNRFTLELGELEKTINIPLTRWIDMSARDWFSGETHVHRTPEELKNVMLAEDLNVAFPLTYWVTQGGKPPAAGDKNVAGEIPDQLIEIDETHVFWPRNTEWEIFTINGKRHTLGAVFALGHKTPFDLGAPPVGAITEAARAQGALLDLDKHDWPWSMAIIPTMDVHLFELANNHVWRTQFGFTNWNSATPEFLRPPLKAQSGNERDWVNFILANYYILLNCGQKMVPTAGTASGVHPVPLGFGRAYVHCPDGFSYDDWKEGLSSGRSFITTGPMLLAQLNQELPGKRFTTDQNSFAGTFRGEIISEQPLAFAEIIINGEAAVTIMPQNRRTTEGAFQTEFSRDIAMGSSGWVAVRCWEDRPGGRFRYAHTAPWWIDIEGKPLLPRKEERDYLVTRTAQELERGRGTLPEQAIEEYEAALAHYQSLPVQAHASSSQARRVAATDETRWLQNMKRHNFSAREAAEVLAISEDAAGEKLESVPDLQSTSEALTILPYPGGRHPRIGFLEGAFDPQRETKLSVFAPWDASSYVVVDLPEAIWSNLGLTYLAHRHIPTIWDQRQATLPRLEWKRDSDGDGAFKSERTLPNGIKFGATAKARPDRIDMELWLHNGTDLPLSDLRVQNCVMLKGADGFHAQSNSNKLLRPPFAAAHSGGGQRWVISAWEQCQRAWANPPVPCLHSDPQFDNLRPGETDRIKGWLWFYEGADIESELARLSKVFFND